MGHSSGGACISYALEHLPEKISKAVYLCATMVSDGQKPFDVFAEEVCLNFKVEFSIKRIIIIKKEALMM